VTDRLLADGSADDITGHATSADDRQAAYEHRLRDQIESIVTSVVGPGHARVQLTAEFDFNRVTETSDRFDPEGRVLRSSQTREEQTSSGENQGQVTVGNELPGSQRTEAAAPREASKKSEEITNYEISRSTKTEVIEGGRIKRLSAAVLVDGSYAKAENGDILYQPRAKEDLDRIAALVRTAVGFDQKRGDQVEVVNLRFAEQLPVPVADSGGWMSAFQLTKDDVMRSVELVVMGLLGIVVVLVVVRPLVRRIVTSDARPAPSGASQASVAATSGAAPALAAEEVTALTSQTAKMIDMAQVQGQVHAQSIQKVGELAQRNPHETVSIIREWLQDSV